MGSYYVRPPFEPYFRCSMTKFRSERPIERSFSQLQDSACRNTVKWRVRPSNTNHCMGDVVHTLGCQKGEGFSEPYLRIPTTDFQSHGRLKGPSLGYMSVLVETPLNRAFVRLMQIIARVTPYILWVLRRDGFSLW